MLERSAQAPVSWEQYNTEEAIRQQVLSIAPDIVLFQELPGIVPFIDAGNAFSSQMPNFSDLRVGAGVGLRYYTAIGPIRLDVAFPLDRRKGESPFAIYLSLGQAF